MLFYTALALACFIAATVCIWLFRSMVEVGKTAYRAILPSARSNQRQVRLANLNSNLAETPSPWGWNKTGQARHNAPSAIWGAERRAHRPASGPQLDEKVPWGWKGGGGMRKSNIELISEGIEGSAAVASVKNMLGRLDHHGNQSGSGARDTAVGWPYREESFDFGGRNYKVKRQRKSSGGGSAKPWGW